MKNGKRPTKRQKMLIKYHGLNAENWLVSKNTSEQLYLVHRYTSSERFIPAN